MMFTENVLSESKTKQSQQLVFKFVGIVFLLCKKESAISFSIKVKIL